MTQDNRCWTCNLLKYESEVRLCKRQHCDARTVLKRAEESKARGETRPSRHVTPTWDSPIYVDPYAGISVSS
jgi:hypothetical protein